MHAVKGLFTFIETGNQLFEDAITYSGKWLKKFLKILGSFDFNSKCTLSFAVSSTLF